MAWFQTVMVSLHLIWASLGMALLIRQMRLGVLAQVIAGLAFGLSGYLVSRAGFLSINAAVSWLPWIILGITKLLQAYNELSIDESQPPVSLDSRRYKLLSAYLMLVLGLAMQLLSGHAQTTWYSIVLATIWTLFFVITGFRNRSQKELSRINLSNDVSGEHENSFANLISDERENSKVTNQKVKKMFLVGLALFFALSLAALQLFPTIEYLFQSQRIAEVDYEFAISYSFWPWRFLSFLAPDLFGNPVTGDYWGYANYWEDAIYIGLIPFVLAIAALLTRGKKVRNQSLVNSQFVRLLFFLILISFVIALGRNTPIYPWLYQHIPTFDMFQAPTRITILAIFSLAILSAIGADSWSRPRGRSLYWLRLGVMAAAAITIGAGIALLLSRSLSWNIRPSFIRATAWLGFWAVGLGFLALKAPQNDDRSSLDVKWGWWQWAVIIWIGFDLLKAGWGLNPSAETSIYHEPSPNQELVTSLLDGGRLYLPAEEEEILKFERFLRFDTFHPFSGNDGWESVRATFLPNVNILDSIPSANNFDPLLPGRYSEWNDLLDKSDAEAKQQLLNLMGVTVVENIDLSEPYGVRFDSREAYPRIRWVACGLQVENADEAIRRVTEDQIDFTNKVIIEVEEAHNETLCGEGHTPEINVSLAEPSKLLLEIKNSHPGYLVFADVWYPGWQAIVDDEPTPVLHANYLFRAVGLPSGDHEVIIAYKPAGFYWGAVISGLAFASLLILIVFWVRMKVTTARD